MCVCPDCQRPMHEEVYVRPTKGNYSTFTCQTPGCLLQWVTLTPDSWSSKSQVELEAYREMNRKERVK